MTTRLSRFSEGGERFFSLRRRIKSEGRPITVRGIGSLISANDAENVVADIRREGGGASALPLFVSIFATKFIAQGADRRRFYYTMRSATFLADMGKMDL